MTALFRFHTVGLKALVDVSDGRAGRADLASLYNRLSTDFCFSSSINSSGRSLYSVIIRDVFEV